MADEVPAERLAVARVLRLEVLRPASASACMSATETYFVAATIVTPGPISSRMRK